MATGSPAPRSEVHRSASARQAGRPALAALAAALGVFAACCAVAHAAPREETKTPMPSEAAEPTPAETRQQMETNRPLRRRVGLTLTVGQDAGDLRGADDKILQAGVDYLDRKGGGTLLLLPGVYALRNAVHLRGGITLRGSGPDTVLKRTRSVSTPLVRDADWYEYGVQVKDPTGFSPGGGILLSTKNEQGVPKHLFATVTAVHGDVVYFDQRTEEDFWPTGEATASTLFSLLSGRSVEDVRVENLVLDGNRGECGHVDDNFGAAVFLQYCNRWEFRDVTARNYNGDGFSFQVCDDIRFEDCQALDNADLGFHPGSGSQRPVFRRCIAKGNSQGFFFCWGVSDGLAEGCTSAGNLRFGVSIGHRDTENVIRDCTIEGNGEVGVVFRQERRQFFSGDRNVIERCVLRDNGAKGAGIGIDVRWLTRDTTIRNCRFENTDGRQVTGIAIGKDAGPVTLEGNTFRGCRTEVLDGRGR